MTDKIVVFSMCDSEQEAERIAASLVEKRLAACVNVIRGVKSVYRWKGAVERSDETMLVIKSTRAHFDKLRAELVGMHTYEVPEVIALPIVDGSPAYLEWIDRELVI
jgi:uncharacterized protein involved in tolerance to divalent cations